MSQQKTQTDKYWVEDFQLEQSDIDHLYNVLLEIETPLSTDQMALILVRNRVRIEAEKQQSQVSPGDAYIPRKEYRPDDVITLPQFAAPESGQVLHIYGIAFGKLLYIFLPGAGAVATAMYNY